MTELTEKTQTKRWKYATIIAVVMGALVAGGFLAPATWVTTVLALFGV